MPRTASYYAEASGGRQSKATEFFNKQAGTSGGRGVAKDALGGGAEAGMWTGAAGGRTPTKSRSVAPRGDTVRDELRRASKARLGSGSGGGGESTGGSLKLAELMEGDEDIARVVKADAVYDNLTTDESAIIDARVARQRHAYKEFEKREKALKNTRVRHIHPHLTAAEVEIALVQTDGDEAEATTRLLDPVFVAQVRHVIADASTVSERSAIAAYYESVLATAALKMAVPGALKAGREAAAKEAEAAAARKAAKEAAKARAAPKRTTSQETKAKTAEYRRRLNLDAALAQGNTEGWSAARVHAYEQIGTNPNAYYYRFNAPGEKQGRGKFSAEEHALFMARLAEVGAAGQWGIFAMGIPGRVGYQCANYYRQLIERGIVSDPDYEIDDLGKAHYISKGKRLIHSAKRKRKVEAMGMDPESQAARAIIEGRAPPITEARRDAKRRKLLEAAPAGETLGPALNTAVITVTSSRKKTSGTRQSAEVLARVAQAKATKAEAKRLARAAKAAEAAQKRAARAAAKAARDKARAEAKARAAAERAAAKAAKAAAKAAAAAARKSSSARRRHRRKDEDDDPESFVWKPSTGYYSTKRLRGLNPDTPTEQLGNPLPGVRDPVTLEEVESPAMSPFGHVMSHSTWRMCLAEKPKCPFTNAPLTLKDLVVLTHANIEEFRPRIVNL
ncbi:uncharacterized protein AMSG_04301 [Thecamonas trahens ATCC 50062]|uniref:Uncharacterized protein n=1 Tax=Thecamonas trahens ATCC 50062 TaxID=461836 RepID=A0A0L0D7B4_THETB|nr:hypothetical protein AMSG_04301 [Thecamonas trahens ATCC 50062]KNC48070.1 hypothetical protein AMSG_04301 [Thecamonas trahens ATCC 50062]|eukprot:XP_013759085.1 hypothetical protein AMSG_04301 [Thecamonas trahens ATCC 50062]